MGLAENVARNVKVARRRKKLSQEGLAAKAGLSVSYISMIERGARTAPLGTVELIAKALGVPALSLLER